MADETKLGVEIEANVTGDAETKALADAVSSVNEAIKQLAKDATTLGTQMDRVEQRVAGVGKTSKATAAAVGVATKALQEQAKAAQEVYKVMDKRAVGGSLFGQTAPQVPAASAFKTTDNRAVSQQELAAVTALSEREAEISKSLQAQLDSRRKAVELARQLRTATPMNKQTGTGAGSAEEVAQRFQSSGFLAAQAQRELNAEAQAAAQNYQTATDALFNYQDRLANTRYALYGLTTALGVTGAALIAANVGVVAIAANFEKMTADIGRTAGVSGEQLQKLQQQFIELGTQIPESYQNLGQIATLAGQLDVPASNIAAFTKVTAQFTATTNVSAEQAATAFGRLDALLPDVQGNYEALGSSILNVGVNSVATESEIIQTTNQIAAAGQQAGLSAKQIIGLAASYASLGVAPEAARGTTIRVFSEITTAVNEGGKSLDTFAKLAGTTAEQFQSAWSQDAGATFLQVLKGLQQEGSGAETTLRGLGITAVRDINALLKLSQNTDLVNKAFADAATGFDDATQLGSSFARITETVAAKAQELWNSLQALFGTLGESGLPAIAGILDGLKGFIGLLTEAARNPFVQGAATLIGAFTALSGILALVTSGVGRFVAALLAGRPVWAQLNLAMDVYRANVRKIVTENIAAGTSMSALEVRSRALGGALKGALSGAGIGLAITAAVGAVSVSMDYLKNEFQSAGDRAKEAFGNFDDIGAALRADSKTYEETGQRFGKIEGSISRTTTTAADWVGQVESVTGGTVELNDATQKLTKSTDAYTFSIGQQTAALLANKLANDQTVQDAIKKAAQFNKTSYDVAPGQNTKFQSMQFDVEGPLTLAAKGDAAGAKKVIDQFRAEYVKNGGVGDAFDVGAGLQAKKAIDLISGALEGAATQSQVASAVMRAFGVDTGDAGDAADEAATQINTLQQVQNGFQSTNAIGQMAQDYYTLAQSIAAGGATLDAFSSAGFTNIQNLQSSIASTIDAAGALGLNATEAVAVLFSQLQAQGISTAQLLASLANINVPGVSVKGVGDYLNGTKQMSSAGQQLAGALGNIGAAGQRAAASTKKVGKSSQEAAKQVYTLANYASDLGSVFDRSFTLRFGGQQGLDTIASGWQDVANKTDEANKKFRDAQNTLAQLASDKRINEYFLSIAQAYGDTLRAGDISAKLADINGQIADASKDASDAQADASKELEGNSAAAIANRKTITDLVKNYEDYIQQLAASGADQATLTATSAKLKQEFIAQATQLGYNSNQIQTYAAAFDDLTIAIQGVPRNITVSADTNPARQAVNEFLAGVAATKARMNVGTDGNDYNNGYNAGAAYGAGWVAGTSAYRRLVTKANASVPGGKSYQYYGPGGAISPEFFASGGYTGGTGTRQIAGMVHGQEYVINAENTSRLGVPFLNALNSGKTPAVGVQNSSLQVVELSAQDRALLQAIPEGLRLYIGNRVVSAAADSANLVAANRGAN